jgi:phospholipid/cholesterol/gamma-HCH transport system ATP-binding protein
MIRLEGVHKAFPHTGPLLAGISVDIPKGSRWGLIGPGACGKTVLLKLVCGLLPPDAGKITVDDVDITSRRDDQLGDVRGKIGMLFQNYALFDFMSVFDNVAFPLERRGNVPRPEIDQRVRDRLRAVGLGDSGHKRPAELSGGMKKRVGIARATIARPDIVIYDEPTAGLDPVTTSKVYDLLLADHAETKATVVAVSSDVDALVHFVDRIAMLYKGQLLYDGPSASIHDAEHPVVRQFVRGELEGPL